MRREDNEVLSSFNRRLYSIYCSLPLEIKPSKIAAMVYYILSQHSNIVLFLRERESTYLLQLFIDVEEVEENILDCGRIQRQYNIESAHEPIIDEEYIYKQHVVTSMCA